MSVVDWYKLPQPIVARYEDFVMLVEPDRLHVTGKFTWEVRRFVTGSTCTTLIAAGVSESQQQAAHDAARVLADIIERGRP